MSRPRSTVDSRRGSVKASGSALERSIKQLVRGDESDAELDRLVADLIVREARERNAQGNAASASSVVVSDGRPSRHSLNTRFLNSVVRRAESHNRALRNTEAGAEGSRHDDSLRHAERTTSSERRTDKRRYGEVNDDRRGRMHAWSDEDDGEPAAGSSQSVGARQEKKVEQETRGQMYPHTGENERRQSRHRDDNGQDYKRRKRHESREQDSHGRTHDLRRSGRRFASPESPKHSRSTVKGESKMDKYFSKDYDPLLDIGTDTIADKEGLVDDEGWERMLGVLHDRALRKEECRESRRMERERRAERKKRGRRRSGSEDGQVKTDKNTERIKAGNDALDTRYIKRGSTREWDMGKASP